MPTSKKQIRSQLEKAVEEYGLLSEIFPKLDDFYNQYMVFYAQLREGDNLDIRIKTAHDRDDKDFDRRPVVNVFLVESSGKEREVLSYSTGSSWMNPELYGD